MQKNKRFYCFSYSIIESHIWHSIILYIFQTKTFKRVIWETTFFTNINIWLASFTLFVFLSTRHECSPSREARLKQLDTTASGSKFPDTKLLLKLLKTSLQKETTAAIYRTTRCSYFADRVISLQHQTKRENEREWIAMKKELYP